MGEITDIPDDGTFYLNEDEKVYCYRCFEDCMLSAIYCFNFYFFGRNGVLKSI